jgi:hypothetical protein
MYLLIRQVEALGLDSAYSHFQNLRIDTYKYIFLNPFLISNRSNI